MCTDIIYDECMEVKFLLNTVRSKLLDEHRLIPVDKFHYAIVKYDMVNLRDKM